MTETVNVVKVTVNLPEDLAERFKSWAGSHGKTFTTTLHEAMMLKLFISEQLENNAKLLVEEEDGTVRKIEFHQG